MDKSAFFCKRPWSGFEIEHDGTVKPCCMAKESSFGNINYNTIEEIWNGPKYQDMRKCMASGQWEKICKPECPRLYGDFEDSIPDAKTNNFDENYKLNAEEIRKRFIILSSKPRFWKLTHSTRCNMDCIMCYQDRNDLRELPEKFYQEMIEFHPYIQEIELIGGETLAIKRFRKLLSHFANTNDYPNLCFSIVTNGSIHDDKTMGFIRRLNVTWISISIDAATHDTYNIIRRGGNFDQVCCGIEKWVKLGRERGIVVLLSFTIMKDNVHDIPAFISMARKFGVDCIFGKVQGSKGGQNNIDPKAYQSALTQGIQLASRYKSEMEMANLTLTAIASTFR